MTAAPARGQEAQEAKELPTPALPGGASPAPAKDKAAPPMSESELAQLKQAYDAADLRGRDELRAYYGDLGIDLESVLGISKSQQEDVARAGAIIEALSEMDFNRPAQRILTERARLVSGERFPNPVTAPPPDLARWINQQAIAGNWEALQVLVQRMPEESGRLVAVQILTLLGRADAQLLPEEVLAVAAILPDEPKPVDLVNLGRLLRPAVKRHGSAALIKRLNEGKEPFRLDTPAQRRRVLELLVGAELVQEAYAFLPDLAAARAAGDTAVLLAHGRYLESMAAEMADGPEAEARRREAWGLYAEVARAGAASTDHRREAIRRGAGLMPRMPRTLVDPWLADLFASEALTRIAAEVFAMEAAGGSAARLSTAERADTLVSFSHAVEAMLDASTAATADLAVPLRVLASAVSEQLEAVKPDPEVKQGSGGQRPDPQTLLRAVPSAAWLDAIDRGVSTRVSRAAITVAIMADEHRRAVEFLRDAVRRTPPEAPHLAEHLLNAWRAHLAESEMLHDDWYFNPSETITRGFQRRQLESLRELIGIMSELGVDAKHFAATAEVFAGCHQEDEVYRAEDIELVFGPLESIPPQTAARLAESMRENILAYWNTRITPPKKGVPRTPTTEIRRVVNKGYDAGLALVASAQKAAPTLWYADAVGASIAYDRLRLNMRLGQVDAARELELLGSAFAAFERAGGAYAAALRRNEQVESADIYARWFRAALGAGDVSQLRAETLPTEGSIGDAQFDRIRAALQALPEDAAFRHTAEFAREVTAAVEQAPAEVKPRLVRAALRVVADHPAGATLRSLSDLYQDLVRNDLRLRLVVDGPDRVERGKPFAALLTLRYTNAVERSEGGFDQYLTNMRNMYTYTFVNGRYRGFTRDRLFRDDLERGIREAFSRGFDVRAVTFFDAALPGHGVLEDGEEGWLEKPLALISAVPKDETVDQLPQVSMQMYFNDRFGEVAVVLPSNTSPITVTNEPSARPCVELKVTQTLDARAAAADKPELTLEVVARGRGTIPDLADLLDHVESAPPGWTLAPESIETRPLVAVEESSLFQPATPGQKPPPPPEPDELGVVRPLVERSWFLRYARAGGASGAFTVPALKAGVQGTLTSQYYGETDLVPMTGPTFPIHGRQAMPLWAWIGAGLLLSASAAGAVIHRRRRHRAAKPVEKAVASVPERITPVSAVMTLRKWQRDLGDRVPRAEQTALEGEIVALEQTLFGPGNGHQKPELDAVLARWSKRLS